MAETEDSVQSRAKQQKIRVIFPNGEVICCKRVVDTFIKTIRRIGPEQVASVGLEVRHHPLVSKEKVALFKDNSKPVDDKGEWYVITESDTAQKEMQLMSISSQLGLGLIIERKEGFDKYDEPDEQDGTRRKTSLTVSFPDGEVFSGKASHDTYVKAIVKIGPERLAQKGLECMGRQVVTRFLRYQNQVQVDRNHWVTTYATTADRAKVLNYIKSRLGVELTCMVD